MTTTPDLTHDWRDSEVYCEDCGTHPAVHCERCGESRDLIFRDDPRDGPPRRCPGESP